MSESASGNLKGPFALLLALQLVLGLVLAQLYLSSHNSLHNNGRWTSTKTTVAEPVMGAYSFLFALQPMTGGVLNLSAWHGYQEIVLERELDPASVEFDFLLTRGAHLTVEIGRTKRGFTGIRLSKNPLFPPVVVRVSPEGEFVRKRSLKALRRVRAGSWQTLRIRLEEDLFTVLLDDQPLKTLKFGLARPYRIGFRGAARPVFIDNVRVESRDGGVFRETFSRPRNWPLVVGLSLGGLLIVSLALFLSLRALLRLSEKTLLFYFLMFTGLLIVVGLLFYGLVWRQKRFYPDAGEKLERQQAYWRDAAAERIFGRIEDEYPLAPTPGTQRLLFLGSSQTRGSGAAEKQDTFVRQTERLLNERSDARRFECINAAVSAYTVIDMARDLDERWLAYAPTTVIVNAANNDTGRPRREFKQALEAIITIARRAGIRVVFIMEPNSIENDRPALRQIHGLMAEVADRQGVPVIDMHSYLIEHHDDGFLWWDWVHLTSFGHRSFAERLVEALVRLGVVELSPPVV